MKSIWSGDMPKFERLKRNISTDVLIIGGGIAGILTARLLFDAGIDYTLIEAKTLFSGVSKNTTAKITSQHGLIYAKLIREFGVERARLYLRANEEAIEKYRELLANIDCDFEITPSYVYSLRGSKRLLDELEALDKLGFPAEFVEELPLPFPVSGAVRFCDQAQFNPVKFASHIARGLNIYEHTQVKELRGLTAVTDGGEIKARRIVVATHFPFINKHGSYFLKLYQQRAYVLALENAPGVNGMYVDENETGLSFRDYKNMLLLGGGSHRTGKPGGSYEELEKFCSRYYPRAREVSRFATQDCMTLDSVPYIGRYSALTRGFYVLTGFNKWGMTSSMVAARLISDILCGVESPYEAVFSPSRSIIRPQLFINALEATVSLLTPSARRCPHLGCALKWNSSEHTWDCPCHGSRFTKSGKLINDPATGDLPKE